VIAHSVTLFILFVSVVLGGPKTVMPQLTIQRRRPRGVPMATATARALADPECVLVNRNRGSGTRVLIDRLLAGAKPPGFLTEAMSHNAVAAAVAQGRADWGVAINTVAEESGLGFLPFQEEHFDFVAPKTRWDRPPVRLFREALMEEETRSTLRRRGFQTEG